VLGSRDAAASQSGGIGRASFGVDHNFPSPILDAVKPFLPFAATTLLTIDPRLVEDKDDWEVILALHQLGYDGLITADYNMTRLPREMAVIHQTRSTLVAIEAAGDNPLRAVGQLLVQSFHVARAFRPQEAQVFRIGEPRAVRPASAWARLGEMASEQGRAIQEMFNEVRLTQDELDTPVVR